MTYPEETAVPIEDDRTGLSPQTLERAIVDHLYYSLARTEKTATTQDLFKAVALAVRDRLMHRWMNTHTAYYKRDVKRVYYLSAEFLLGRTLQKNVAALGILETLGDVLERRFQVTLEEVIAQEVDPGLGNGGLGRLAACFLDSMATLDLPGYGYGIRYEFGIFHQHIEDGWQVEQADAWLRFGNPWEVVRHEYAVPVGMYGHVEHTHSADGRKIARWLPSKTVLGVPYDTGVAGFGTETVNTLRLWSARASRDLDLAVFNDGDYRRAVEEKAISESISKVLYPKDTSPEGKELRLKQQYFFVCCSIHDIMRRYTKEHDSFDAFADKVAVQLNDTHPAIAVAELMRVLVDQYELTWDHAWTLTQATVAFTNHTLLSEALERWSVAMFERLLPRHLEIIYEINRRFLEEVHIRTLGDVDTIRALSLIEEGDSKMIRMAHLAVVGSHSVNGVAQLHSKLIQTHLLPRFYTLWPEKFNNKTNGVTPRRWLHLCNPSLSKTITQTLGSSDWIRNLDLLADLRPHSQNHDLQDQLAAIKADNKRRLARLIHKHTGVSVSTDAIFDVQIKRIHQYKRQLLNTLHIISLYRDIKAHPNRERVPRVFIFGGKAAPGYAMAKLHIKLINDIASIINRDPDVHDALKVVFLPNYGVSMAEVIIPGTDISEQISMAGKEASGTGNMKFAMNGALTVGTLDGANIEIRDEVGPENFFLFGLEAQEVRDVKAAGYDPKTYIAQSEGLRGAIEWIEKGFFSAQHRDRFLPVVESLTTHDPYLVCADFESYAQCHRDVAHAYTQRRVWLEKVIMNLSGMGTFSSDRTIRQYAQDIWGVRPWTTYEETSS